LSIFVTPLLSLPRQALKLFRVLFWFPNYTLAVALIRDGELPPEHIRADDSDAGKNRYESPEMLKLDTAGLSACRF
jgi:hypothetical protein